MMDQAIQVLYGCSQCGLLEMKVTVVARKEEDVAEWMKVVVQKVGDDHYRRSPHCTTKQLDYLKIPVTDADRIGGPPLN